ncbi:hypothetical protein R1sor_023334 [Riccia sorocarpa]|uniref:Integrase catalytic domain-containing protein n=1 Tax=Riccia sorocarpa TaxID=122646 RepID=A0ABD3GN52_9MARC
MLKLIQILRFPKDRPSTFHVNPSTRVNRQFDRTLRFDDDDDDIDNYDEEDHRQSSSNPYGLEPIWNWSNNTDARVWVRQLQITSKHYGWTEEETLNVVTMSLRGCAATWYSAIERRLNRVRNPRVRLDEFHKEFADRFIGASDTNITRQILNIEQKHGENTRSYTDRLQSLANRLDDPLLDHVLQDAFGSGLQSACRTHLINRAPKTLQGVIKFAVEFQSRYGERNPYQEPYMSTERRSKETTGKLSTQDKSEYGKIFVDAGIEPKILKQLTRQQEEMEAQLRSLRESIATMGAREEEELIQQEVDKMLEARIVSSSSSPWSALVVLVPKKDEHGKITDKKRVCIDYRQLNKLTKKYSFPMPLIDDMLDRLGQFDSYCLVDLKRAYWQIKMDPSSKEKTAFATKNLYECNRMAMGLKNAPASFQRLMNRVLANHSRYAQSYFNDIMIMGATKWKWTTEQEKAFRLLKECLLKPPILRHANFALMFIVQTYWQSGAIAAILAQRDTRKYEKRPEEFVVAYASKRLSSLELNYSPIEGECYAVVWDVTKVFRQYLYGKPFIVETDHLALQWLMSNQELHGRLGRWSMKLQAFDFDIQYRKGKAHTNVDALGRVVPLAVTSFLQVFGASDPNSTTSDTMERAEYLEYLFQMAESAESRFVSSLEFALATISVDGQSLVEDEIIFPSVDSECPQSLTMAQFVREEILARHGYLDEILTDGGREFLRELQQVLQQTSIRHRTTSAYNPQANGLIERFNRTLLEAISRLTQQEGMSSDAASSSEPIFPSPKEHLLAVHNHMTVIHERARVKTRRAQQRQVKNFAAHHEFRNTIVPKPEDLVYLGDRRTRRPKLSSQLKGPFLVLGLDVENHQVVIIENAKAKKNESTSKKFYEWKSYRLKQHLPAKP